MAGFTRRVLFFWFLGNNGAAALEQLQQSVCVFLRGFCSLTGEARRGGGAFSVARGHSDKFHQLQSNFVLAAPLSARVQRFGASSFHDRNCWFLRHNEVLS